MMSRTDCETRNDETLCDDKHDEIADNISVTPTQSSFEMSDFHGMSHELREPLLTD